MMVLEMYAKAEMRWAMCSDKAGLCMRWRGTCANGVSLNADQNKELTCSITYYVLQ
jgi:hypothetical protein